MSGEQRDLSRILQAVRFAAIAHDGQRYGDAPYIVHPVSVVMYVLSVGGSDDQAVAAALHDTLEDTHLTYEDIEAEFGTDVAEMVQMLTHDPLDTYERYVAAISGPAALVKFADSAANLSALREADDMDPVRKDRLRAKYERNCSVLSSLIAPPVPHDPQDESTSR